MLPIARYRIVIFSARKLTFIGIVDRQFLTITDAETAPPIPWFAATQGVQRKQDLADLPPKGCFISAEAVERVVGQIGETQAGAGAGAAGGTEAALTAGGATGDGGAGGAVAIGATAPDPRSPGGAAPGLGVMDAVGSDGQRETNSSLEPALARDVWLELLGPASLKFGTFWLGPFSALIMDGSVGKTAPGNAAR